MTYLVSPQAGGTLCLTVQASTEAEALRLGAKEATEKTGRPWTADEMEAESVECFEIPEAPQRREVA